MSAGIVLNMRTNFPDVMAQLDRVADEIGNRAVVRALVDTITQGKTEMARDISKEFRINVGTAKDRLSITRASSTGGTYRFQASLEATTPGKGRSMNVIAFVGALPKRTKKGKLAQIKFKIKRDGGWKTIPGAFIGNQGRTMFIRVGKGRLPIKPINTIDIPQMFNTRRINEVVQSVMLARFEANIERELRVVLQGFAR